MSAWRWFFSFYGRIGRGRFFAGLVIPWIFIIAFSTAAAGLDSMPLAIPVIIVAPVSIISSWAIVVKRLHDCGISGWWALIWSVLSTLLYEGIDHSNPKAVLMASSPSLLLLAFLLLWPGHKGYNIYG